MIDRDIELSMIVPAHNEGESIDGLLKELNDVLLKSTRRYEIIVVDDGSTDQTGEKVKSLPFPVTYIRHPICQGNGTAVRSGILAAKLKYVGIIDADGQHPPESLPKMIPYLKDHDLVVGSRVYKSTRKREIGNYLLAKLASYLTGTKVPDLTCGYRIFNRDRMLNYVHLIPKRFSFPSTSTIAFITSGYPVKFVPMDNITRKKGSSKINFWADGVRFGMIVTRMVMLFNPMRVFFPIFILFLTSGIGWSIRTFLMTQRLSAIGTGLLISSVLTILFGLLAEQVCAIRVQIGPLLRWRILEAERRKRGELD